MSIRYGTLSAKGTLIAIFLFIFAGPLYALSPVADIDVDEQYPCKDGTVCFDGSASYDPNGGPIQEYDWTFPAAATNVQDDNTASPSCEFNAPGIHAVTLIVQDYQGEWSDQASIDIFVGNPDLTECYVAVFPEGDDETGNGSIDQPFATIQHAIYSVCDGATIYIKPGTYTGEGNYNVQFHGRAITVMNLALHNSVYTGEVVVDCQEQGRGFTFFSDDINCVLKGVVVNNGKDKYAGAIYTSGSPTIRECQLINNESTYVYGGGGFKLSGGSPKIINCWVTDNYAPVRGGGFYIWKESPEIRGCVIARNSTGNQGGAIFRDSRNSAALFINCSIWNNSASYGGAFYDRGDGTPTFVNCVLWGNNASTSGGEIYAAYSSCNITVNYSDVEGGLDGPKCAGSVQPQGEHNIDTDPLFKNPTEDDFHLLHDSPCVNTGDPSRSYTGQTDIDGESRFIGSAADMGADEFSGRPISHWKLDETSGNIAYDSAGDNDGTVYGAAWVDDGRIDKALSFDGSYDYIPIGDKNNLETQAFTLSFWAQVDDPSRSFNGGVAKGRVFGNPNMYSYQLYFHNGNTGASVTNTTDYTHYSVYTPIGDTDWHLWTMTAGDGVVRLYKDGDFKGSRSYTGTIDYTKSSNQFSIGARDYGAYALDGKLDEIRFYDRVLSDTEIAALAYARIHNVTNDTWYMNIQDAIDSSSEFDIVELYPGIYYEQINFEGKAVTLRSTDPDNWGIVAATVIDADEFPKAVIFENSEGSDSKLIGLTIRNTAEDASQNYGYGVSCSSSSPLISKCIIEDNENRGIHIVGSSSSPEISNNIITNNYYGVLPSTNSSPIIKNNLIYNNNCGVQTYNAEAVVIRNNTIVGNTSYGVIVETGTAPMVSNCILWNNSDDLSNCSAIYSCISNCDDVGDPQTTHNICDDPQFVVGDELYHLDMSSPCINIGDSSIIQPEEVDIDGEERIIHSQVDMGADEVYINIRYVDAGASPGGDGISWETAFDDLQSALADVLSGDEIWVAQGTYKPTTDTDRTKSFDLISGVAIYGGFTGNEIHRDGRDWNNHITILSGDIGTPDDSGDNSYHVVVGTGTDETAVLDGFVIMDGNADGSGGYYSNYGGGLYNDSGCPTLANCKFLGNHTAYYGGAVYNRDSGCPTFINCILSGNSANYGGGIYSVNSSSFSLINCTLCNNTATYYGGGIRNNLSNPSIINCIIWGNSAGTGSSIANASSQPYISYSDIEGCGGSSGWVSTFGIDGGNNIDIDSLFVDPDGADNIPGTLDDDLGLQPGSPCIGSGIGGENMGASVPVDAVVVGDPVSVTNPVDLAIDSNGQLYVLSSSQSQILIYNDQLELQDTITVSAANPYGISLDGDNNLYIADTGGNRILKYTLDQGSYVLDTTFDDDGIVGQSGTDDGEFYGPLGIAVGYDGKVYVSDLGNSRMQIFDQNGQYLDQWGQFGSGDGQLSYPTGFYLNPSSLGGEIFLADYGNHRIQRLSANSGYFLGKTGEQGTLSGQFNWPVNVSYDSQFDQLAVADMGNNRIQLFQLNSYGEFSDNEMTYIDQISDLNLFDPMAVSCASNKTEQILYIADTGNNRILKVRNKINKPGKSPQHVFEGFKAALNSDNLDMAITFFSDMVSEKYIVVLTELNPIWQDMLDGMGEMMLVSSERNVARYEMLHDEGGGVMASFPVFFCKDGYGNWKIYGF